MDPEPAPEYEGSLTIALHLLLKMLRDQESEVLAGRRAAGEWERRAVLGTATLANQLGLRVREAEARERRLRQQIAELASRDEQPTQDLRSGLARLLGDCGCSPE